MDVIVKDSDSANQLPMFVKTMIQRLHQTTGIPLFSQYSFETFALPKLFSSLVLATQNPDAFRSILLLAAVHYSWKTGALNHFESTYLLHKLDCIRAINHSLADPNGIVSTACIKTVATLCITEVSRDVSQNH